MTIRYAVPSVLLGLMLAIGCAAPPPAAPVFTPEDEAAVAAAFEQTVVDFRAGDFANWASRFSDDAVFHAPNAPAVVGRAAIQAWSEAMPAIEAVEFTNVRVWGDGNVAWGVSDYALTLQGMPSDRGKQLAVLKRTNGVWQTVAVSFNTDLPMPEAAGAGSRP
jgi:ketosteroid isomerase-like protein